MESSDPANAKHVRNLVDGGEEKTLDYYVGARQVLVSLGEQTASIVMAEDRLGDTYRHMIAYTSYQISELTLKR